MVKQHDEPRPGDYASRNSVDATQPPHGHNKDIRHEARHAGDVADAGREKKHAQDEMHEGLRGDRPKGYGAGYIKPVDK
ncbi:hypothetical protein Q5752_003719 [Cryptotrichosporon argae]